MQPLMCPVCHTILEAYDQQIRGEQSLVCPVCSAHFYSLGRDPTITRLPRVDIERFMPNSPRYGPYDVPELDAQVINHLNNS